MIDFIKGDKELLNYLRMNTKNNHSIGGHVVIELVETIDRLTAELAAANAKVEEMQRVAGQWRVAAEKLIGIENLAVLEAMANKLSTDEAALAAREKEGDSDE